MIKRGEFIVSEPTEKLKKERDIPAILKHTSVLYINDNFPLAEFLFALTEGFFKIRPATLEEKEFCYWVWQTTSTYDGANLEGINQWREWKTKNII